MKPENRALVNVVVAVAIVTGFGVGYLLLSPSVLATSLPVPAGTTFTANETEHWAAHVTVGFGGARLVGSWTAYDGMGFIGLVVVNGTIDKPWPPPVLFCPLLLAWQEQNGSIDQTLAPGPYTVYWSTGSCSSAQQIVVTQAIELEPA